MVDDIYEKPMVDDIYEKGMGIRRKVLGDTHVDLALAGVDDFTRDFQSLVTRYCWGECWGRDGLTHRQRSLNNICMLAAINRPVELATHIRAALRNGATVSEIRETLIQVAVYAGIPAGYEAFRIAHKVLVEEGALPSAS